MLSFDLEKMLGLIRGFQGRRVLVLGDIMLDRYIWGNVVRISPEAPVPVVEVMKSSSCLGGAGNVGQNLISLGAFPVLVGVVGPDEEGLWVKKNIAYGHGIFKDKGRPTTVKMRIIAHNQQVVRVDQEKNRPIPREIEEKILDFIRRERYEGILVSDYNKGLITKSLMKDVLAFASRRKIMVFVDPKIENFHLFSPVTFISPNHLEAEKIVRHACHSDEEVERAGREILGQISSQYLIIKRGEQGMAVFERGKKAIHIPTIAREVYDVTGAGDTVIATAALSLLAGASIREAALMANAAAGIVVGKIGTAAVTPEELVAALRREAHRNSAR